jgi:hypothetical protein
MEAQMVRKRVRYLLVFFVVALVISGLTAVPLIWEINILQTHWISFVYRGLTEMSQKYPFIFYGTDWLAFAHVVIAVAFWGPLRDPIKNIWVVEFGMIACVMVIPLAMIFGPIRGIPFFWRLADCSFGVFGIIPLWLARNDIRRMIALEGNVEG